ncbi:MAG TPA: NAD(P)-dependent oxidoreductase [Baekduia sp.]|nr:NAD(P)-dependent oxidoreductase [Baekduia sp.]
MPTTIAFLGLGIMGSRMAANLSRAGLELRLWTRTAGKAQAWAAEHGGVACATPAEAAQGARIVVSMVVDGEQVREVLLGADGAARGLAEGGLCVDMSTIAPADARALATELGARGLRFVDAPVTGSSPKAADGTLTIMCGGAGADVAEARPLFDVMGDLVVHVGAPGQGQALKVVNNAVAAVNTATVAQALLVADALEVDLDAAEAVLGAGSGGSAMLVLKARPMREHDFATLFKAEHMLKDVRLCLDAAQDAGVPFPAAAAARDALVATVGRGLGAADFAAVLEVFEAYAGRRLGEKGGTSPI